MIEDPTPPVRSRGRFLPQFLPQTDNGRALLVGLVMLMIGLAIGLPPLALWGPGAALIAPGILFVFLAFVTPPEVGP
jgi:hypothetical protein